MKKALLFAAILTAGTTVFAQQKNVTDAKITLEQDNDPVAAKGFIEKAILDPSTKDEAKTWFVRASIYLALFKDQAKYNMPDAYIEATRSLEQVIKLKSDFEKNVVTQNLIVCAYSYFNAGIVSFNEALKDNNAQKYNKAASDMKKVIEIRNIESGKRYEGNKSFDTVASTAKYVEANSYFYSNQYNEALPLLQELKNDPINKKSSVYQMLAEIYSKQNKDADFTEVLQEGRKLYPDDQQLRNTELNYYIKSGKQDELVKKLEDAVTKDPNNAELLFALAVGYNNIAFPKDDKAPKPTNYKDYADKAETNYLKAIQVSPDNAVYNFNLGALYFNEAADINGQMNKIPDSDTKKYDLLKGDRDKLFVKATPYIEKTYSLLDPKASTLSGEDKSTYRSSMIALKELYARQNKADKAAELKKKIETYK